MRLIGRSLLITSGGQNGGNLCLALSQHSTVCWAMKLLHVRATTLRSSTVHLVSRAKLFTHVKTTPSKINAHQASELAPIAKHFSFTKIFVVKSLKCRTTSASKTDKDLIPIRFYSEGDNGNTRSQKRSGFSEPQQRSFFFRYFEYIIGGAATAIMFFLLVIYSKGTEFA